MPSKYWLHLEIKNAFGWGSNEAKEALFTKGGEGGVNCQCPAVIRSQTWRLPFYALLFAAFFDKLVTCDFFSPHK